MECGSIIPFLLENLPFMMCGGTKSFSRSTFFFTRDIICEDRWKYVLRQIIFTIPPTYAE